MLSVEETPSEDDSVIRSPADPSSPGPVQDPSDPSSFYNRWLLIVISCCTAMGLIVTPRNAGTARQLRLKICDSILRKLLLLLIITWTLLIRVLIFSAVGPHWVLVRIATYWQTGSALVIRARGCILRRCTYFGAEAQCDRFLDAVYNQSIKPKMATFLLSTICAAIGSLGFLQCPTADNGAADPANAYETLTLNTNATTQAEINLAHETMAATMHPEKNPNPNAAAEYIEMKKAFYTLSKPIEKCVYDCQNLSQNTLEQQRQCWICLDQLLGSEIENLLAGVSFERQAENSIVIQVGLSTGDNIENPDGEQFEEQRKEPTNADPDTLNANGYPENWDAYEDNTHGDSNSKADNWKSPSDNFFRHNARGVRYRQLVAKRMQIKALVTVSGLILFLL